VDKIMRNKLFIVVFLSIVFLMACPSVSEALTWAWGSVEINQIIERPDGSCVLIGQGYWQILNRNMSLGASGTSSAAYSGILLNDGRVLMYHGKNWQVLNTNNTLGPAGSMDINAALYIKRPNGEIVTIASNYFQVLYPNLTKGPKQYHDLYLSSTRTAIARPDNSVVFTSRGSVRIIQADNSVIPGPNSNFYVIAMDIFPDGTIVAVGEDSNDDGQIALMNTNNVWYFKKEVVDNHALSYVKVRSDNTVVALDRDGLWFIFTKDGQSVASGKAGSNSPDYEIVEGVGDVTYLVNTYVNYEGKHAVINPGPYNNVTLTDYNVYYYRSLNDTSFVRSDGMLIVTKDGNISYTNFAPGAPTFANHSQSSVQVSWSPPTGTDSSRKYHLELSLNGVDGWTEVYVGTATSCTVSGLSPGTRYYFRVRAEHPGWYGGYSAISSCRTVPPTPQAPSGTTSRVTWSQTVGRSKVVLTWPGVQGATGYKVWVFDGYQYRAFDVGATTTWDSSQARIYPDPNWLASQADNSIGADPFNHAGGGFDLQDDPNILYCKTVGTTYDDRHNYWFRISAYNESGESPYGNAYMPTLPNATDNQQPTGSINAVSREGLEKTYDTRIKVTVNVGDSLSGICRVELSNDGVSYTIKYEAPLNPDNGTGVANYANTFDWDVPLGAGTKVVYARITDAVGNQKVVTDTIALAEDMLPPSLTLTINGGAESTTSAIVTLTLSVQDNASTTSQMQMRFSNDGNLWSPWEPFAQTKMWDITASAYGGNTNPGIKKVYAQVCDQAQNVTLAVAEIGYNPNPPTGTVTIVGGSSGTWNGNAALFTSSDAPTLSLGFSGATYVRFDPGTGIWGDWEAYTSTKNVYLVKSSGVTRLRVQVKDAYGVASSPQEFLVVVDPTPPVIQSLRGLNGATATTSYSATLEISVKDNISGVLYYQYQVNEGYLSSWVPLSKNTIVVSGFSRGANRITVNVKDQAGNIASASTTIFKI